MVEIERDVADNYRALRAERGLTWEQLAAQVAPTDRNLAAWFRSQTDTEGGPRERKRTRMTEIA